MKKNTCYLLTMIILTIAAEALFAQESKSIFPANYKADTRIDNMGYWRKCAEAGLVPVQPYAPVPPARFSGSKVLLRGVTAVDSPDVPVTNEPSNSTQSENSIVVNPNDPNMLLNSNNSTPYPSTGDIKGADGLKTLDGAATWSGSVEGAGGMNYGDPAAVIDLNGRWYIGYIDNLCGQSISYSDNNGATWTVKKVATASCSNMLDKNHLWVDISPSSPYKGYLYDGWMAGTSIYVSRSITGGTTWNSMGNISTGTAAGSHNQGVNFKCGPDGEVYAAWAVYDSWVGSGSPEKAIGFNKSLNGGTTWGTAFRAINNLKGIRSFGVPQNMRVNSFPSMAVDLSNSPYRGTIYIVWTNVGYPGINTGTGTSVYLIKSTDKGVTWSAPKRINSDSTAGKQHYLPWITCDQANGYVSVVFYDNRNCGASQAEAWMAYSRDGGNTFADLKVSDVTFTPAPIPNLANQYMGDYLAIAAYDGKTFPCWTDTRSGHCLTYVSPVDITLPRTSVENTGVVLNDTTLGNGNGMMDYGETELVSLKMKNTGNIQANAVSVQLFCENPFVTLLDSIRDYGNFEVGEEKTIPDGYKFKVSDSIPNNEQVMFTVKAVDQNDSTTWSTFQIAAHAPDVTILSMMIDDPLPGGNANGRLDPGEDASIKITTGNSGMWDAENVGSGLTSLNMFVNVGMHYYNIGTLPAGQTVTASFPVHVNDGAATGSVAQLLNVVTSKYRSTAKYFNARIGLLVEDWETGNFNKFPWQFTNSAKPWTIDSSIKYEGEYSARSGAIGDNESSGIFIEYNASIDDSISFFRRTSCQPDYDNLKFYIDNLMVGMWSNYADTTFNYHAFPVMAGPHIFKWVYEKDNATSSGLDATWADFIIFPPQYRTTVNAGDDVDICAGSDIQLHGLADNYDSVYWSTDGTGQFTDPGIFNPVYMPSALDIQNGMVHLMLTGYGINTSDTDSLMLMIYTPPATDAGEDGSVCKGQPYFLAGSSAIAYSSLHWETRGDGNFDDPAILHPTYTPGVQDILVGSVKLMFTATGSALCPVAADSSVVTIFSIPQVDIGKDTVVCANGSLVLDAAHPDASAYLWLPSNKTTPSIAVDSAGIGLHSEKIIAFVTDNHGCTGKDSVMVSFKVCGEIDDLAGVRVRVFPNPNGGIFTLELKTLKQEILDLAIISPSGETVYKRSGWHINGEETENIDFSRLSQGTYILQVSNGSGKLLRKLVIQK